MVAPIEAISQTLEIDQYAQPDEELRIIEERIRGANLDPESLIYTAEPQNEMFPGRMLVAADSSFFYHPESAKGSLTHPLDEVMRFMPGERVLYAYPSTAFVPLSRRVDEFMVREIIPPVAALNLIYQ